MMKMPLLVEQVSNIEPDNLKSDQKKQWRQKKKEKKKKTIIFTCRI